MTGPRDIEPELPDLSALAERLRFPFPSVRAGQSAMLRDVDGALDSGLVLLCSAPTGIGKTAAVLYPALRRALGEARRVFFVTHKGSQQELALETLRRLVEPRSGALAVQLIAKERSCPFDGRRCAEHRCRYQDRFADRLRASGLAEELAGLGVVDGATVAARALDVELCPFETALALVERAHVVVCDVNYVFDPNVYLRRCFDADYDRDLLVVDEAHNLPARAAGYYSPALELGPLREVACDCAERRHPAFEAAAALLAELTGWIDATLRRLAEERDAPPPWLDPPDRELCDALGGPLEDAVADYAAYRAAHPRRSGGRGDPLRAVLFAVRDFFRCAAAEPDLFATLWSPERVRTLCLDPAPFVSRRTRGFHAAVFMSATLSPFEFYLERLGAAGPRAVTLDLASPFPRRNRLVVQTGAVDTTYRHRSESAPEIARIIRETIALRRGSYLAFFSSFRYRDEVVSQLEPGDYALLLQVPGAPATSALAALRRNRGRARTLLLCGVQGGVLAEGVDYPGDMAHGVFVVGPGLPQVSPEQELTRSHYDRKLGAGFEYAYVYPGLNRAVQAGGRAIRAPDDRAFIMLLGRRFAEPLYRRKLPDYWQRELVEADDPVPVVRTFWAGLDSGS